MSGAYHCPNGGIVRLDKGQLLPTIPLIQAQGQKQDWPVTEVKSTPSWLTIGARRSQSAPDQKTGMLAYCVPPAVLYEMHACCGHEWSLSPVKNFTEN